jgi:hypothetical protein
VLNRDGGKVTSVGARTRSVAGSQKAASVSLVVGVSAGRGAVLLDHVDGGGVDGGDDGDVAVSARSADPQVSRLGVGGLGDTGGVAAAHHIGVVVPDGGNAVLLVHVALGQLHALVSAASGDGTTAAAAGALVLSVALRGDAVVARDGGSTGGSAGARSQVVCTQLVVRVHQSRGILNAGHRKSRSIISGGKERQNRKKRGENNGLHGKNPRQNRSVGMWSRTFCSRHSKSHTLVAVSLTLTHANTPLSKFRS